MTSPSIALFKALLNVSFGLSALRARVRRRERIWELLLVGLSLMIGAGIIGWVAVGGSRMMIRATGELGQPEVVLTLAHAAATTLVFFFAIPFLLSAFYFSDDTKLLLSLPLSPREILAAKFSVIVASEYLSIAPLLVPVYIVYGLHAPTGWWYAPAALIVFLLTPVVPLALAALVVVLLMRVVSTSRKRDFFTAVGGLLALALAIGSQYFSSRVVGGSDAEMLVRLATQAYGLSELVSKGYPPSLWSMLAMAGPSPARALGALAALGAVAAAAFYGVVAVGNRVFLRAAQSTGENGSRRASKALSLGGSTPILSVARVERKLLWRTPIYAINGLGTLLIIPFAVILSQLTDEQGIAAALVFGGSARPLFGVCLIWGWLAAAAGLSTMPATAVSREGRCLWMYLALPLTGREFFLGKLLGAGSMVVLGALPGALAIAYVVKLSPAMALLGLMLGLSTSALVSAACLAIDLLRPWLDWTEPARAMKSNVNSLLGMLVSVVLVGGPAALGVYALTQGASFEAVVAAAALFYLLAALIFWRLFSPRLDQILARAGE